MSKEVGTLSDSNKELLNGVRRDINSLLTSKLDGVATETKEYINSLETLKEDSKNRFKSFFDRWKIIDYLVLANLTIVPILLLVLSYMVFFKK